MRRVLRSLEYEAQEWTRRAGLAQDSLGAAACCGRRVYARRQAKDRMHIADRFKALWLQEGPTRGQKAGRMDDEVLADVQKLLAEDVTQEAHSTDTAIVPAD